MNTISSTTRPDSGSGVTFGRVIRSEWIKLRSLRTSFVLMLSSTVATIVVGTLGAVGVILAAQTGQPPTVQAVHTMPTSGLSIGQLLLGALAVLLISSEYGTGMVRSSLTAVPARVPVLLAKATVIAALGYAAGTVATIVTYALSQPILAQEGLAFDLHEHGVLGSLLAAGLYLAFVAVLGLGVGTLFRNSAGAIVILIALLFVLPTALSMFPGEAAATVLRYLPSEAGNQMLAPEARGGQLNQVQGAVVMATWAIVPFIGAIVALRRRDV